GEGLSGAVVLLVLARPELFVRAPHWGTFEGDHTRLELRPLDAAEAERMLRSLLERAEQIPPRFVAEAVEMTGGNPFFLGELVRLVVADGTITSAQSGRWRINAARASAAALPMTVEEAVQARIAALEPAERDVLEKAAALGNVFWTGALVVLTRLGHETDRP